VKFFLTFVNVVLGSQAIVMAAPPPNRSEDYALGSRIGGCLVVACEVFRGFVLSESPKSGGPITIHVEEVLFGMPNKPDQLDLPYEDLAHARNGDGGNYLASAWANVTPSRNTPVTVVFALESGFLFHRAEPVLVTSDERETGIIRSLTEKAAQLDSSPDLISEAIASLSSNPNPPLAGYLFTYLTLGRHLPPTDITVGFLSQLLGNPSVPAGQADSIAAFLVFRYYYLSPGSKMALISRFAELGQQADLELTKAAYYGLGRIAEFDHSVRAMVPSASLSGLESTYRSLVKKGSIPRNQLFEAGLAIKYE
jgi:hypothetical protein